MKTTKIGGKEVCIFDNIDELPMLRFHAYNKAMLIDAGVGSDLNDWDSHIERTIRFMRTGKNDLAERELNNLRQNVYFIQTDMSPKYLAFAALVKSVDGVEYNDLSPDGLRKVSELFANVPHTEVTAQMEAVKKKIDSELLLYFPKVFEDVSIKQYYDNLKQRTILMLDSIIDGDTSDKKAEIEEITNILITYSKPQIFHGKESVEIQYDRQFENMCLMLSQQLNVANPKSFSVLEYYNAFEFIKESSKAQSKSAKTAASRKQR